MGSAINLDRTEARILYQASACMPPNGTLARNQLRGIAEMPNVPKDVGSDLLTNRSPRGPHRMGAVCRDTVGDDSGRRPAVFEEANSGKENRPTTTPECSSR